MVGTLLAFVALAGLAVALVSRLKISPGLRKKGIGPESWRQRVEIACGLTSGVALILSLFMLVPPGARRGRLAWDPVMEMNPVIGIRPTGGRPELSTGKLIREMTVAVSADEQQADLGPVTVIIPPGTLEKAEAVQAREAPREIMPPVEAATLAFVDIRIGAMTRFEKPLTLKFPVQDLEIDPDLPPGQQFFAAYFDAGDRSWKQVPFRVDPADKTISVRTDHLTVYWIGNLFSLDGKYCTVYFLPSETRSVNSGYESALGITTTDKLPLSIIRDIAFFVDTARESFSLPGTDLPLPGSKSWRLTQAIWGGRISVLAFSGSNASWFEKQTGKSETYTGTWSGDININLDAVRNSKDKLEELRNDCAHELFHLIQREEYGIIAMDLYNFRAAYFWLDAAAECAASTLAWRTGATRHGQNLGPTRANLADFGFLKETLVSNSDPHRYQAARFIEYLLARCQLTGRALLDIPRLDSVFSVSFDKFMAGAGQDLTLARAYDDFAAFFVFDPASPCAMGSGEIFLEVKKYFSGVLLRFRNSFGNVPNPVAATDHTLTVKDRYTSDMTCFRPDLPCTITLSIEQDDRYVSAGVFPKESGKPKKVSNVFKDNPASFQVAAQETLVLLFTPLSPPAAVRVHVKPQLQSANLRVKVIDAVTSGPVSARVRATLQNGQAMEKNGAEVVFQDIPAGDVRLAVSADGYGATSSLLAVDPEAEPSVEHVVSLEPVSTATASFAIQVQDEKTGNAVNARVVITQKSSGRSLTKNGSSAVFGGLKKGSYEVRVTAKGYKPRSGEFTIADGRRENQSVCKLEREPQTAAPVTAAPPPPAVTTPDYGSFAAMLKQRRDELYQLCEEVRTIENTMVNCCSNQAHYGTPFYGMVAIVSVEKFGQSLLGCRNCGMKFSTRESRRPDGKTYLEHYRERVAYYDKLLQQAPPGFWDTHQYEDYGGLDIIEKK